MPHAMPTTLAVLAATLALAAPVSAEVISRTADGFILREEKVVAATPAQAFAALGEVGQWWNGDHTYSGSGANLSLPLQVGACLCEALTDGTTFEHGRISALAPETGVTLEAPLGPLKSRASRAKLAFQWRLDGDRLRLTMTYAVEGEGLGAFAGPVDGVMTDQFARLARHLDQPAP